MNIFDQFHLRNNTKPKMEIENLLLSGSKRRKSNMLGNIRKEIDNYESGYQVLSITNLLSLIKKR